MSGFPARIRDLLESERRAILEGDYLSLSPILIEKETLLEDLSTGAEEIAREEALELRRMAEENDRLIDAALRGMQATTARIRELEAEGRATTYTGKGARVDMASPKGALRQKL